MPFGASAKTKKPKSATSNTESAKSKTQWFNLQPGIRVFRLPEGSQEVKIKRYWLAQDADTKRWIPSFGYNPADKRLRRPVTVARHDPIEDAWIGDHANWYDNPVNAWIDSLPEDERKGMFPQERFYLNVIDLTNVKIAPDGKVYYPNARYEYPDAPKDSTRRKHGIMTIFDGTSGDSGSDTLYGKLHRAIVHAVNEDMEPLQPHEFELRAIITQEQKRLYDISIGAISDLDPEYAALDMYELESWTKPWPNDALYDLLEYGKEYMDVVQEYDISLYPTV